MTRLWALATNTFREAIRDRIWISILVFALASILFSIVLKEITIGDQAKVVRSIAQGGVDFFSAIIAMFLGISLVWKELDKKHHSFQTDSSMDVHSWKVHWFDDDRDGSTIFSGDDLHFTDVV